MERESTSGTRRTREVSQRVGRLEKKTEFSKPTAVARTDYAPVELIETELGELRPYGHSYLVYTIFLAINFLISGLNSLRGIAKTFEILSIHQAYSSPNFNTIRQWVLRLGLYELNQTKEYRSDWIFILDMTIEIGKNKCLVILGIPQEKLARIIEQEARSLQHQDVEVLSLEILDRTIGTVILEKLNNLAERVGNPIQIVSDRGSDIKKGIDLYLENNPMTLATYDITHKMANLLKQELSEDKRFQEFFKECSLTRQRVQQTDLCFLSPPTQRAKSRYHNIDILITWAIKMIIYEEKQDFSAIDNTYILDRETYRSLSQTVSKGTINILKKVKPEAYENLDKFSQAMSNILTEEYLVDEVSKIPPELILLGSSDVLESLFGKYKIFAQRRPIKELGASILLIPLSTIEITIDRVKQAMESISFIDVVAWSKSIFGSSMLSRRRSLSLGSNFDTEPA